MSISAVFERVCHVIMPAVPPIPESVMRWQPQWLTIENVDRVAASTPSTADVLRSGDIFAAEVLFILCFALVALRLVEQALRADDLREPGSLGEEARWQLALTLVACTWVFYCTHVPVSAPYPWTMVAIPCAVLTLAQPWLAYADISVAIRWVIARSRGVSR
jgi:hypothetical protein